MVVISMTAKAYKVALENKIPKKYIEDNRGALNDISIYIKDVASISLEGPFKDVGHFVWQSPWAYISLEQKLKGNRGLWRVEPLPTNRVSHKWGAASSWILSEKESQALLIALQYAR
jgi:hypothetical protein